MSITKKLKRLIKRESSKRVLKFFGKWVVKILNQKLYQSRVGKKKIGKSKIVNRKIT